MVIRGGRPTVVMSITKPPGTDGPVHARSVP
jgi:hypothetical protein